MLFDLCIIDEASQMPPEDALGALARCKQVMVVGDTKQLPPKYVLQKLMDDDQNDDDALLEESILELANNVFRPPRRLRWHYRSADSSLIAISNSYVYDSSLAIFPSATPNRPTLASCSCL